MSASTSLYSRTFTDESRISAAKASVSKEISYLIEKKILLPRIAQKKVINTIFEECIPLTDDDFWKYRFALAARGTLKDGFSFKDRTLYFRGGKGRSKKSQFIEISDDARTAITEITNFMYKHGVYSNQDEIQEKLKLSYNVVQEDEIKQWTKIPKKNKDSAIEGYVYKITKELSLNKQSSKSLKMCIKYGVKIGAFDKTNITVDDGKISKIDGYYFTDDGIALIDNKLITKAEEKCLKNQKAQRSIELTSSLMETSLKTPNLISSWNSLQESYLAKKKINDKKVADKKQAGKQQIVVEDIDDSDSGELIVLD